MKSVHFYVGITSLESIFSIKSFNINVVYLSFSHSPTLSLTIFRSANSELYFQHNFLTWSKWRQRRKWLEVTKQNSGKEHTDNARKKNEREKDERIVGTGFMHHEISILISMLTQNFIWKELSIFFLLFITCAIRRGRLIPLFLFREKGKCVDLDVDAAFSHVILYLRPHVVLVLARFFWCYASVTNLRVIKNDVTKMIMMMMKLKATSLNSESAEQCAKESAALKRLLTHWKLLTPSKTIFALYNQANSLF